VVSCRLLASRREDLLLRWVVGGHDVEEGSIYTEGLPVETGGIAEEAQQAVQGGGRIV
jgi:hypothetical protein